MEQKRISTVRKLSVFVLVFAIVFALAGCVRYEARSRVNADGTVDFSFVYAMSTDLGSDLSTGTKDAQKAFADAGWDLEEYKEDKYSGFRAVKKHIPLEDLEKELNKTDSFNGFSLREVDDGEYVLEWDVSSLTSDASSQGLSKDYLSQYGGYMRFVLEVPGEVIETNGSASKDGSSIEWNFFEINDSIYAKFSLSGGVVLPSAATIAVNKDKTADVSLDFEDVEDMEQFDDLEEMGWDISGDSDVTASQEGVDLEDLEDLLVTTELGFDDFTFSEKDGVYTLEWDASGKAMNLTVELPNEAEEENADSSDDNVLEWDLSEMEEPVSAQFKIKKAGFPILLVAIIGGSILVVGIVILVIVLIVRKKKNKGDGPKNPSPVVEVPAAPIQPSPIAPQSPAFPQQYAPQAPATPQVNAPYVPQPPVNPTAYTSGSGLPNPGLPQIGSVPPQGPDNNAQN